MKFMNMKRFGSAVMAGALALSLSAPAFAADPNTTVVTGTYQNVVIAVDVPATGTAQINPYGLDVKIPNTAGNGSVGTIKGQQIVTQPLALKNKTAMDLNVAATVTGAVPTAADGAVAMKLATATTKGVGSNPDQEGYVAPATAKSAFVYLQAKQEPTLTGADAAVTADAIGTKFAAWTASAYNADTDVVVGTKAVTKEGLVVLRAADMSGANDSFAAYKAGSIALFRLAGDCVMSPKDKWTTDDSFTANIAFTFTPATIEKNTVTVDTVGGTGTTTGVTVTADYASAAAGDVVTITLAGVTASETATIAVKDADNAAVTVTPASFAATAGNTGTTATFTMPAKAVTITVTVAS